MHITSCLKSQFSKFRYKLENGLCLCVECHDLAHRLLEINLDLYSEVMYQLKTRPGTFQLIPHKEQPHHAYWQQGVVFGSLFQRRASEPHVKRRKIEKELVPLLVEPSVIAPPAAKITEPPAEMLSWNPSPAPLNSAKDPIHASPAPNDSAKDPIHASPAPPDSAKDPIHALPNLKVVYRRKGKS